MDSRGRPWSQLRDKCHDIVPINCILRYTPHWIETPRNKAESSIYKCLANYWVYRELLHPLIHAIIGCNCPVVSWPKQLYSTAVVAVRALKNSIVRAIPVNTSLSKPIVRTIPIFGRFSKVVPTVPIHVQNRKPIVQAIPIHRQPLKRIYRQFRLINSLRDQLYRQFQLIESTRHQLFEHLQLIDNPRSQLSGQNQVVDSLRNQLPLTVWNATRQSLTSLGAGSNN